MLRNHCGWPGRVVPALLFCAMPGWMMAAAAQPDTAPSRPAEAAQAIAQQTQALHVLLAFSALFVLVSAAVLVALALVVRRSFWAKAADSTDRGWRNDLMQLPLGVPEGSVRALLSIYVVMFGLLVLVLQQRLGLANVDAITGFVGVVITFYFTSRGNDQAQKAAAMAARHAQDAARAATDIARVVTTDPAKPTMASPEDPPAAMPNRCTQVQP